MHAGVWSVVGAWMIPPAHSPLAGAMPALPLGTCIGVSSAPPLRILGTPLLSTRNLNHTFSSWSCCISTATSLMCVDIINTCPRCSAGSIPGMWNLRTWLQLCIKSPSTRGVVGQDIARGDGWSYLLFLVSEKRSQSMTKQQYTVDPASTMAPRKQLHASTGVRLRSRKTPTKGVGR